MTSPASAEMERDASRHNEPGANPRAPALKRSRGYRADIDGLRALAILAVVAFHAGMPRIGGGFIGVDVFFVISGYLISAHIYRDLQAGTFRLRSFYERRAKRILPAFLAVTLACYLLGTLLLAPAELQRFATQAMSALGSSSNIYFWLRSDYFAKASETQPLLMTWSLGVEEQFYLFFPLLLILLRRCRKRTVLLVLAALSLASFAIAVFQTTRSPQAAFFLLPSRWWELGCGTLLGIAEIPENAKDEPTSSRGHWWSSPWLGPVGLVLLLLPTFVYHSGTRFPGLAAVPPVLAALCLIQARHSWINTRLLASKPLVFVGLVSYSWYLWHWPLLSFAHSIAGGSLPVFSALLTVLAAFGLAVLSYYAIETPFRRAASGPRTLLLYGSAMAAFAAPALLLYFTHGLPARYPQAAAVERAAMQPDPALCLEQGSTLGHPARLCRPDTAEAPTLAVLGDSHASAMARYLRAVAPDHGWAVTEYTKASCPQLGSVARASFDNVKEADACLAFNRLALARVLNDPHIQKVVLAGFWSAPFGGTQNQGRYVLPGQDPGGVSTAQSWANFQRGLSEVIEALVKHGKVVAIATDVPHYEFDPLLLGLDEAIPVRHLLARVYQGDNQAASGVLHAWDERDLHANQIVRSLAAEHDSQLLDLAAPLCRSSTCFYTEDHQLLYMDFNHLSVAGVRFAIGDAPIFSAPAHPAFTRAAFAPSSRSADSSAQLRLRQVEATRTRSTSRHG